MGRVQHTYQEPRPSKKLALNTDGWEQKEFWSDGCGLVTAVRVKRGYKAHASTHIFIHGLTSEGEEAALTDAHEAYEQRSYGYYLREDDDLPNTIELFATGDYEQHTLVAALGWLIRRIKDLPEPEEPEFSAP